MLKKTIFYAVISVRRTACMNLRIPEKETGVLVTEPRRLV